MVGGWSENLFISLLSALSVLLSADVHRLNQRRHHWRLCLVRGSLTKPSSETISIVRHQLSKR